MPPTRMFFMRSHVVIRSDLQGVFQHRIHKQRLTLLGDQTSHHCIATILNILPNLLQRLRIEFAPIKITLDTLVNHCFSFDLANPRHRSLEVNWSISRRPIAAKQRAPGQRPFMS